MDMKYRYSCDIHDDSALAGQQADIQEISVSDCVSILI